MVSTGAQHTIWGFVIEYCHGSFNIGGQDKRGLNQKFGEMKGEGKSCDEKVRAPPRLPQAFDDRDRHGISPFRARRTPLWQNGTSCLFLGSRQAETKHVVRHIRTGFEQSQFDSLFVTTEGEKRRAKKKDQSKNTHIR